MICRLWRGWTTQGNAGAYERIVRGEVGEDYSVSHAPAQARAVLSRFDERAAHFEVLDRGAQ